MLFDCAKVEYTLIENENEDVKMSLETNHTKRNRIQVKKCRKERAKEN